MSKQPASKKAMPEAVGATPKSVGVLWRALVLVIAVGAVMAGFIIFAGDRTNDTAETTPPAATADSEQPTTR